MLHLCYIYGFVILNYWLNSEGVTQLIQRKVSKQITEMVHELWTNNVLTKLSEMCFNDSTDIKLSFLITHQIPRL